MARRKPWIAQAIIYLAARAWLGLLGVLPLALARRISMALGRLALALVPRLHRVGRQQLDLAYGDTLDDARKRALLREAMDNLALVAAEFPHAARMARAGFPGVTVRGREHFDPARPCVMISGHMGNWEWMAAIYVQGGRRLAEVVRPLDFPAMNAYVDRTRRSMGIDTIPKADAASEIMRLLGEGCDIGILVDQSPRESAVPVTFFGRDTWATIGPALIASRAGVPIHFLGMARRPDGGYDVEISPPIIMRETGDKLADLQHNTQRCQDVLEEFIRRHPGQWLWFHRRWKERPRLQEEWEQRLASARGKKAEAGNN